MFTKELDQDSPPLDTLDKELIDMYPELSNYKIDDNVECHITDSKSGGEWRACKVISNIHIVDSPKYKNCVTVRVAKWKYDHNKGVDVCYPATMAYFTDLDRILLRRSGPKKENGVIPF